MSQITRIILILLTFLHVFGFKLHEYMTKREVKLLFNYDKSKIHQLNYEVAPVFYKRKRSLFGKATIKLKAFSENYINYLDEADGNLFGWTTKMYKAKVNATLKNNNKTYIYYEEMSYPVQQDEIKFFQDRKKRSAITAFTDSFGKTHINGFINDNIVVRSIPDAIVEKYLSNNTHLLNSRVNSTDKKPYAITAYHIVIHKNSSLLKAENQVLKKEWSAGKNLSTEADCMIQVDQKRPRAAVQNDLIDVVYPEILVVIDYDTFRIHEKNYQTIAAYLGAFWNAVDLIYREMKNPKVRLNIAGVIVTEDPEAEPYIVQSPIDKHLYSGRETLENMGRYFHQEFPKKLCNFDIVVGISEKSLNKRGKTETAGMAYYSSACHGMYSTALVKDVGFMGIDTAAHEMGHLFGASHDGDDKAQNCPESGYMMSTGLHYKTVHWSECSMTAIQRMIRNYGNCLVNKPDVIIPHRKKLPGKVLTRDEQCDQIFPGYYSDKRDNCNKLSCKYCTVPYVWCYRDSWNDPPAEGSSCGKNKFCLNSTCVEDPGWFDE